MTKKNFLQGREIDQTILISVLYVSSFNET